MDTIQIGNQFASLTFYDIFIGENGAVALVALMFFALLGNLYKKSRRFVKKKNTGEFNLAFWLKDNIAGLIASFFLSYVCCRLVNEGIEYANFVLPKNASSALIFVGLLIGYKMDDIEDAVVKFTNLKR